MAASRSSRLRPEIVSTTSVVVLVVLVAGCLYWAKPVLVPVALAVLITFVLSPVVAILQRCRVPRFAAILAAVGTTVFLIGALGWIFIAQFLHFANELPKYQDSVTQRIADLRREGRLSLLGKVQDFVDQVSVAATKPLDASDGESAAPQRVKVVGSATSWFLAPLASNAGQMAEMLATGGLVTVLVVLMLLHREDIRNRLIRLFGEGRMTLTTKALDDADRRISRYLSVQLMTNAAFGLLAGGALWLLGVPYALVWGVCAAFLRYIPYLGSWIAIVGPLTLSLLTAEGWAQPVAVVLLFVTFETCTGLLIEPWLYGQSIGVSQAGLLVAIAFWAWLWGAAGLILAPPLTVCLVVLGKYVPGLKFFDTILGDAPPMTTEIKLYQRLLVRDQDEASQLVREELKHAAGLEIADGILVPALVGAGRELESARLNEADVDFMRQAMLEIVEEQGLARPADDEASSPPAGRQPGSDIHVVACPARPGIDETATALLCDFMDPRIGGIERISAGQMVSDIVARIAARQASIICIVVLPPGGLAQTRLLCKRLRTRYPDLKIVVGRWGQNGAAESEREQLREAGAEYFGTSLRETLAQISQLVRCSHVLSEPERPASAADVFPALKSSHVKRPSWTARIT